MRRQIHDLSVDILRAQSEAVLFEQAQAGCQACLNQLMKCHEHLVPFVVRRQTLGQLSFVALIFTDIATLVSSFL